MYISVTIVCYIVRLSQPNVYNLSNKILIRLVAFKLMISHVAEINSSDMLLTKFIKIPNQFESGMNQE